MKEYKDVFCIKSSLLLLILFVAGCASTSVKQASVPIASSLVPNAPCWYASPVHDNVIGQIGTVIDAYTGGRKPLTKSRELAARTLADYLGVALSDDVNLVENDKVSSISLAGHQVYFADDFRYEGLLHSYAVLDNAIDKTALRQASCPVSQCDIASCSPGWLCSPAKDNNIAILGVSYETASYSNQRAASVSNALFAAQYMYGVDVAVKQRIMTLATSGQTLSVLDTQSGLQQNNKHDIPHLVTDQCVAKNTLYTRVALPTLKTTHLAIADNDLSWMKNPKYKGFDGAVGSSEKLVASGLFSDQIKLAIKRAIVQLALEKESNVSESLLNIDYEKGGSIYVSSINNHANVDMNVKVLSMHITADQSGSTQVYAWVGRLAQ